MRGHLFYVLALAAMPTGVPLYADPDDESAAIRIPPQPEPDVLPYRDPPMWGERRPVSSLGPAAMKLGPRLLTNDAEAQAKIARAEAKRARKAAKRLGVSRD